MRRRGGFILLFGTRAIVTDDDSAAPVNTICPNCRQRTQMVGKKHRNWFTLFFIPLFPISGAQRFSQCTQCAAMFYVEPRQIERQTAAADQQEMQRAIGLYNSMRASPANSVTLNELMSLYASIGEYDQAIVAARDFPQALAASEQCMVTLGRAYLAKHQHAAAIEQFDAALERNPSLGEAHYFKAVAHFTSTPPDHERAAAAARLARSAGYPGADQLPV